MGEQQRKRRRQQAVVHPNDTRGRVLLDSEHRTGARRFRQPILDGFRAEQQPGRRERLVQGSCRQRHAPPFTVDQKREVFQERGAPGVAVAIGAQGFRLIARERGAHHLTELRARLEGIPELALGAPGARAREQPGGQPRGEARERAVQHREIDVVDHQRFGGEPLAISRGEDVDESASGGGGDRGALGTADHMRPQRDVGTGEVAPQHVQPLVPAVQLLIVGALEAGAAETEGLQVVSGAGPDHAGRHVGGVGNVLGGRVLPLQRLLSPRAQHDAALRPGGAIGTTGADLRRPSPRGRSSVNGL